MDEINVEIKMRIIKVIFLKDVIVEYSDGLKEFYEAIKISDNGIILGRMKQNMFFDIGFIPINELNQIFQKEIILNK